MIPDSYCPRISIDGVDVDRSQNTINSKPLIFGSKEQIELVEKYIKICQGMWPIYQLEPTPRSWNYLSNIYHHTSWRKADSLVDHVPCINCGRLHKMVFSYDPHLHYDSMLQLGDFEFDCWNCDQEYEVDPEGYVYVKPPP